MSAASASRACSRTRTRKWRSRGSLHSPEPTRAAQVARVAVGLALLLALALAGDWAARTAGLAVPGSVIGMLALALLLETGAVPMRLVQPASELLVRHLALFYVPAGVAVVVHAAVIRNDVVPIVVAALASLVAVLAVVGVVVQRLGRHE